MGKVLDRIYVLAGVVSGGLILAICLLISAQIALNAIGRMAPGALPSTVPSYADFAGFMLAAATFLAMAHTLRAGGHIRVNLVTQRLPDTVQVVMEGLVLVIAIAVTGFAVYFMGSLVAESLHYGDKSTGIVPVSLWIPQTVTCAGMGLFLVALLHTFGELIVTRRPVLSTPDEV